MKTNLTLYLFVFALWFTSCSKDVNNLLTSKHIGSFELSLDSTMAFKTRMIQFVDHGAEKRLWILNELTNSITEFDYPGGTLRLKHQFDATGENGVGRIASFLYHNADTLFLLNTQRQVIMVNREKQVVWRISTINLSKISTFPDPIQTGTLSPMVFYDQKIFLNGMIGGLKNIRPVPYVDLVDKNAYSTYKYPSMAAYTNQLRLEVYYYLYSHTYNLDKQIFVYSFPVDDSLRITNFKGKEASKLAASEILGKIDPYLEQDRDYADDEYELVHLEKKYYGGIVYDSYRNVYYRFFSKEIEPAAIEKSNTREEFYLRENAVMVFDADFNKTGEYLMPIGVYDIKNLFVSPDGLCILNQKKCMENEDKMFYDIFKFE